MQSIEKSRKTTLSRLIYALGIENVGAATAKLICRQFDDDPEKTADASQEELSAIPGIGEVIAGTFTAYFTDEKKREGYEKLLKEVKLQKEEGAEVQSFQGMTFVITGSVHHFKNRNEVKAEVEKRGGKVTGSVTSKTNYLINNDAESSSSKNRKAKELGIPIISEEEFLEMLKNEG